VVFAASHNWDQDRIDSYIGKWWAISIKNHDTG
jgi:hypothetical protein